MPRKNNRKTVSLTRGKVVGLGSKKSPLPTISAETTGQPYTLLDYSPQPESLSIIQLINLSPTLQSVLEVLRSKVTYLALMHGHQLKTIPDNNLGMVLLGSGMVEHLGRTRPDVFGALGKSALAQLLPTPDPNASRGASVIGVHITKPEFEQSTLIGFKLNYGPGVKLRRSLYDAINASTQGDYQPPEGRLIVPFATITPPLDSSTSGKFYDTLKPLFPTQETHTLEVLPRVVTSAY